MNEAVFISYSSEDRDIAETICRSLESRGLTCWISSRDVPAGENFQEAIFHAISGSRAMVLVFSQRANNSNEIKKEVALASQHDLVIIPVRIEDVKPNAALAYELVTRQWVDLFKSWEEALDRLAGRITALLRVSNGQKQDGRGAGVVGTGDPRSGRPSNPEQLAPLLLPSTERAHLNNLWQRRTGVYRGHAVLREELRRLRSFDLIRMRQGRTVAEIADGGEIDLAEFVELTDKGRAWATELAMMPTEAERQHLISLRDRKTSDYRGNAELRKELRDLRARELIRMQAGRTVADIDDGQTIDLSDYVELTDLGREWVARLRG